MNEKHYEAAWKWMRENPRAYALFHRFAMEMVETGQKFGAKLIAERIRWECKLTKIGEFKWSNNHTKYVALRWADNNPSHAHLLTFRNGGKEHQQELFEGMTW